MIGKNCEFCEKEFFKYPSYFKKRAGRFCSRKCNLKNNSILWKEKNPILGIDNSGMNNPMWGKRGFNFNPDGRPRKDGYFRVSVGHGKRLLRHRLLMERKLGRTLLPHEIVHHKDGNNKNNIIDNLEIITQSQHIEKHREQLLLARNIRR